MPTTRANGVSIPVSPAIIWDTLSSPSLPASEAKTKQRFPHAARMPYSQVSRARESSPLRDNAGGPDPRIENVLLGGHEVVLHDAVHLVEVELDRLYNLVLRSPRPDLVRRREYSGGKREGKRRKAVTHGCCRVNAISVVSPACAHNSLLIYME